MSLNMFKQSLITSNPLANVDMLVKNQDITYDQGYVIKEFLKSHKLDDYSSNSFAMTPSLGEIKNKSLQKSWLIISFIPFNILNNSNISSNFKKLSSMINQPLFAVLHSDYIYKGDSLLLPHHYYEILQPTTFSSLLAKVYYKPSSHTDKVLSYSDDALSYTEFQSNGVLEKGILFDEVELGSYIIYLHSLLLFSKEYYAKMDYQDEIILQISVKNHTGMNKIDSYIYIPNQISITNANDICDSIMYNLSISSIPNIDLHHVFMSNLNNLPPLF